MAVLLAQTATGTSNLASTTVTWTNNTITGNTVVVVIADSSVTAGDVSSVTDSQNNVYTKVFATDNVSIGELEVWYSAGIVGGVTPTVTVAYTTGVAGAVIAREYWGLYIPSQNPLDQQISTTGDSTTPSSGNIQLKQPIELLVGAITAPISTTITAGSGFGNLTTLNGTVTVEVAVEDQYVTSIGPWSATFGVGALALQWVCGIVSFYQAPAGTTTSTSFTTSTSMSSTSISSTSSSISSTSTSTSNSSTSTSFTVSSTSISTTSVSTSSTSISSTSSSTSISSTSTSISSTSTSSTSTSSTSISISISSTSTSFSSTSTSISSTSSSVSSTSISSTSSSSSTSTTTLPPPYLNYSYQDTSTLSRLVYQDTSVTQTAGSGSLVITFPNPTTPGNLVVIGAYVNVNVVPNIVGFSSVIESVNGSTAYAAILYKISAGETSFTLTAAGAVNLEMGGFEYTGAANPIAIDTSNITGNGTGTVTSITTSAITTTYTTDMIFEVAVTSAAMGGNGNWVNATTLQGGQLGRVILGQYIPRTTLSGYTDTANWVAARAASAIVVAFQAAPSTNANLATSFNIPNYSNVSVDDGDYFIQKGSQEIIAEFKESGTTNTQNINITWKGRSTVAPSASPVYLQVYNQATSFWETWSSQTVVRADTDFTMQTSITNNVSNYYDSQNNVSVRIYQQVV